jgi:hypothetical protein
MRNLTPSRCNLPQVALNKDPKTPSLLMSWFAFLDIASVKTRTQAKDLRDAIAEVGLRDAQPPARRTVPRVECWQQLKEWCS